MARVGCGNTIHDTSKGQCNQLHTSRREREWLTVISRIAWVYIFTIAMFKKRHVWVKKDIHANYLVVAIKIYLKL